MAEGSHEHGAQKLNLEIQGRKCSSLRNGMGLRATCTARMKSVILVPDFSVEWIHEWLDDAPSLKSQFASFPDADVSVSGSRPLRNAVRLGTRSQ